ncbi:MAG: DUF3857 domain-containing protein [Cyclobacteriaceae bacterium]
MKYIIKGFVIVTIISWSNMVIGQDYDPFTWESKRKLTALSDSEKQIPMYNIKLSKSYQYTYDPANSELICYVTKHHIVRVNNDEALSKNNRIYIPTNNMISLEDIRARSITPSNKIIELDRANIKELDDEEDGEGFQIFAVEGAEVGGEIEYYYTRKVNASYFGSDFIQYSGPVKDFQFALSCPENLEFDFKVFNDEMQVVQTDTTDSINEYALIATNIPELYSESFSAFDDSRKRIEYKLAYNSAKGNARLFTWGNAGKRLYSPIVDLSKNETKKLSKFIQELKLNGSNPIDNLRKAEHYIKSNFFIEEDAGGDAASIDFIINNKYGSQQGFTKLYVGIIKYLGVQYELVITCDRFKKRFDSSFDTWSFLDDYLIYFPHHKTFLAPGDFAFRLGTIASKYLENYGLYIKEEQVQDFTFPVAYVDIIPAPNYEHNYDNLDISVKFDESLQQNLVNVSRSYGGQTASYYKASMIFLDSEQKDQMLKETVTYLALDADIKEVSVGELNNEYNKWNEPFVVQSEFATKAYIEKAGNTIIFKVGNLIGPQSELYQGHERQTDVVNTNNRQYVRKLEIEIPEGYSIKNPEDIKLKKQVFDDDELIFNYEATYEIVGSVLKVKIIEFYNRIYYPKSNFQEYRQVINAAADWNKVALVLKANG